MSPAAPPVPRTATDATVQAWFDRGLRAFAGEPRAEHWSVVAPLLEPERCIGFAVGDRWVATAGAQSRTLTVPGGRLPAAAVTMVTVAPDHRRRGLLRRMMTEQLADVHRRREPVAVLWASEAVIYGRFGYGSAVPQLGLTGRTGSTGFLPGTDLGDGHVEEPEAETFRAAVPDVYEGRLRPTRPGALDRSAAEWEHRWWDPPENRRGASALRYAWHRAADGTVDGYAVYRLQDAWTQQGPDYEVQVVDLDAASTPARMALWRHLFDLDLVRRFRVSEAPADEPLHHLLADARAAEATVQDSLFVRLVDVAAALAGRRYAVEVDVVLEVEDAVLPHNARSVRLQGGPDGATVTRARRRPDLSLDVRVLGAAYLGGVPLAHLARAGLVRERTARSVAALGRALAWSPAPFCNDHF